jgi:two-component system cell cycle sensor histidine kinase/response regulator CckA
MRRFLPTGTWASSKGARLSNSPQGGHSAGQGGTVRRAGGMELTLVDLEDRFRDQPESASDLLCTHDLDGKILSVNEAACSALQITPEVLCTMKIQALLPPGQEDSYDLYIRILKRDGTARGRMSVTTKDGQPRIWEYRNTLHLDGRHSTVVSGLARDITESIALSREARDREDHFRSIIENISDVIAIIERDGRVRYHSPSVSSVLGLAENALVGTPFADLVHPEDRETLNYFFSNQLDGTESTQTIEVRLQHQTLGWRSFEIVAKKLIEKGRPSAIVVNARDNTDRKLLELQLAQANRITSLGHLAATVAHEFNNVLMGMLPFAELLQRPEASRAMVVKGASHIASSIERGKRIALDILRFTQPAEPLPQVIDLGEWWGKFASEADAMLGNTISLAGRLPYRGMRVLADSQQLAQVLTNLIANARDAMPGGGTITVQANDLAPDALFPFGVVPHPEKYVQLSVKDDGPGMAQGVRERIFEPLFTTKRNGGTGLGLAVAHQVLQQHGGHIFVESEIGAGTTFHLFIPVAEGDTGSMMANRQLETQRPRAKKLLMIEDEDVIVDGIRALLSTEGIQVEAVDRGAKALAALSLFRPDIVLLDLGLPDMDGSEVYERIRQVEPLLPVIFATGHGGHRLVHECLGDSHTRFLQKPFEMAELIATIAELD